MSAYCLRVRRKPGALLPIEVAVCEAARDLRAGGAQTFHGSEIARALQCIADARLLTGYGTLYRALNRLEKMGLLTSNSGGSASTAATSPTT